MVDRALPSDAAAVEALLDSAAVWQQERGIDQWTPGRFEDEVQAAIAAGDFYVMWQDGTVVGCFLLECDCPGWMDPWLVEHGRSPVEAMYLGRLAVARDMTGRGLGVELLNAAKKIAAETGFRFLRLNCPAENVRLSRYYSDAGFDDLGEAELRGPSGECWVCSVFESALPSVHTDAPGSR